MKFIIKEQEVEIVTFSEFVKEITDSHLNYLKNQVSKTDYERLQKAIKEEDILEISAMAKSWHVDLNNIRSGVFRKGLLFTKNEDGSYIIQYNDATVNFSSNQVLFLLKNPTTAVPISVYQKDFLINVKKEQIATSLEGCPFNYCDSNPKCDGKCRYASS